MPSSFSCKKHLDCVTDPMTAKGCFVVEHDVSSLLTFDHKMITDHVVVQELLFRNRVQLIREI